MDVHLVFFVAFLALIPGQEGVSFEALSAHTTTRGGALSHKEDYGT